MFVGFIGCDWHLGVRRCYSDSDAVARWHFCGLDSIDRNRSHVQSTRPTFTEWFNFHGIDNILFPYNAWEWKSTLYDGISSVSFQKCSENNSRPSIRGQLLNHNMTGILVSSGLWWTWSDNMYCEGQSALQKVTPQLSKIINPCYWLPFQSQRPGPATGRIPFMMYEPCLHIHEKFIIKSFCLRRVSKDLT